MGIEYVAALLAVFPVAGIIAVIVGARRRLSGSRQRATAVILAAVFLSIGLSLAAGAAAATAVTAHRHSADLHADGTVIELVPSGGGSSPRYRARVAFTTRAGTDVRFLSSISTNPPPAALGDHVDVRYHPDHPRGAIINSFWQMWFLPTLLGIIAAPFVLLGSGFWLFSRFAPPADPVSPTR